jgi:hypothetical protein
MWPAPQLSAALGSRPVADTFSGPVLRDQGPDRPAGHGKADPYAGTNRELGRHCRAAREPAAQFRGFDRGPLLDPGADVATTGHGGEVVALMSCSSQATTRSCRLDPAGGTSTASIDIIS